jgi:hypothetical protein
MSNSASGQMMRQSPLPTHVDMNPREPLVTEEHWINSIVDRWSSSQRKSWRALDPTFRGWVSHLVWVRKNIGKPTAVAELQGPVFQVPSACPVDAFASIVHSVAESMDHFRNSMPDINWNAWNDIEPKFRDIAEWEMSAAHARAQASAARKIWWDLNSDRIQSCLGATATGLISTGSSPATQANQRYEQIDRRARAELQTVDHMIAPEAIKREAREQIADAAAVDKYISDVDRHNP